MRIQKAFSEDEVARFCAPLDRYIENASLEIGIGFEEVGGQSLVFAIDQLFN